jgi:hypothetical protein
MTNQPTPDYSDRPEFHETRDVTVKLDRLTIGALLLAIGVWLFVKIRRELS